MKNTVFLFVVIDGVALMTYEMKDSVGEKGRFARLYCALRLLPCCMSGRKPAMTPSSGSSELMRKMYSMLVRSASHPKKAEPMPPRPNISPKNTPQTSPTLSGNRSVA